jgi:UDP-galactopyranose mutase
MNIIVIGSGLSGAVTSYILNSLGSRRVKIFESRPHLAGNCFDNCAANPLIHTYGPHLFHTPDEAVWNLLSRFTQWTQYVHFVWAETNLGRISIPYNLQTQRQISQNLSDDEIRDLIFKDYSRKQWGIPWEQMPAAITGRVPMRRENEDTRYFTDKYQGQPKDGYTAMFQRMLQGIPVHLGVGKDEWRKHAAKADLVIYTGKIDEYFNYCYGRLPYRSLRFEHQRSRERLPVAVINQCNTLPYTRMYDHRYFSEESSDM